MEKVILFKPLPHHFKIGHFFVVVAVLFCWVPVMWTDSGAQDGTSYLSFIDMSIQIESQVRVI